MVKPSYIPQSPFNSSEVMNIESKSLSSTSAISKSDNEIYACQCQPSAAEFKEFRKKWMLLSDQERSMSLCSKYEQFIQTASELLPCLGCRGSTESLLQKIADGATPPQYIAASGIAIGADRCIRLQASLANNPDLALSLFARQERWGNSASAKLNRGSKSNMRSRCFLHSQKARGGPRPAAFESLWNKLSEEHREQLAQVDADQFLTDLECYLRRHRFCCRCKEKVLEAYDLLIGTSCSEDDCEECAGFDYMDKHGNYEDLQYTSYLFDELSFCRGTGQIMVPCHMDFMSQLMSRADQEMVGDWGDRHARTIAEAQDEVLTCLGMVIWEKLQNMWTNSRCEKRSEELLVYLSVTSIRQSFDIAVEALHGQEMMEQLLAEEDDESRRLARKKEKRKEKKKKRKSAKTKGERSSNNEAGGHDRDCSVRDDGVCDCGETRSLESYGKHISTPQNNHDDSPHSGGSDDGIDPDCGYNSFVSPTSSMQKLLDEEAEMQLLSSMGWIALENDAPENECDEVDAIPEDEITFWKENQSKLVTRRMEQRQKLQERFDEFVMRSAN